MNQYSIIILCLLIIPVFNLWINGKHTVKGISCRNDTEVLSQIATQKSINFIMTEIIDLSPTMLNVLSSMKELVIWYGVVKKVYLKPSLVRFFANNCNTSEFYIDPEGVYEMTLIIINSCNLPEFPQHFNKLKMLEEIHLEENNLELIDVNLFNNFVNLTKLELIDNNIRVMGSSRPINLRKLSLLNMSKNKIESVDMHMFHLNNLTNMIFTQNNIKVLTSSGPFHLPKLQIFDLSYNKLEFIDLDLFKDLEELTKLDFTNNKLRTFISSGSLYRTKLQNLYLEANHLKSVDMTFFNSFGNLKVIILAKNNISVLTSSREIHLPHLESLVLNGNELSQLDVCRWNMPSLKWLWLGQNKLPYVVNMLRQFPNLTTINLAGNVFSCDWQKQLLSDVRQTNISIYEIDDCNKDELRTPPLDCS